MGAAVLPQLGLPPLGRGGEGRKPPVGRIDDERGAPGGFAPIPPYLVVGQGEIAFGTELAAAFGRGAGGFDTRF